MFIYCEFLQADMDKDIKINIQKRTENEMKIYENYY